MEFVTLDGKYKKLNCELKKACVQLAYKSWPSTANCASRHHKGDIRNAAIIGAKS